MDLHSLPHSWLKRMSDDCRAPGYDDANRLVGVAYPNETQLYQLDAVGNRVGEKRASPGVVTALTVAAFAALLPAQASAYEVRQHNAVDWLVTKQVVVPSGGATTTLKYDGNGNRVEEGPRRYAWDIRDTLTQVTDGASVVGGYDYDASLQRVKADTASGHVEYVLDGKYVLRESGARTRRYHYGEGKGLSVDDGGGARWLSLDGLGSTSAEVTPGGSVTANRKHDAWGNYRDGTAPASGEVRLGYTGHQYDVETGLTYARARYYDSVNGVFLSRDSYPGQLDDAPSLHRYAYAHGNPLRYTDPQGRAVNVAAAGIGAGIGFLVGFGAALWDGDSLGDAALTGAKTAAVGALAGLTFGASLAAGAGVGAVAAATGGKLALGAAASYGHQQLEIQAGVRSEVSAKDVVLGAAASAAVPTGKAFTVAPQAVKLALGGLAVGGGAVAMGTGGAQVAEAMEMADSPSPALQARAPWMGALGATNTVLGLVGIGAGAKIMPKPVFASSAVVSPIARITTRNADPVDSVLTRKTGEMIASDPVASRSYAQIQNAGFEVEYEFGAAPAGQSGATWVSKSRVDIFARNTGTATETVSTLVHESSHVRSAQLGRPVNTLLDEYMAFRREHLFQYGERPSLPQRRLIWQQVQKDYPDLPVGGEVPSGLK